MPQQARDPLIAGAALVQALQTVVSRTLDPLDPAVISVTRFFAGGEAYNVIPAEGAHRRHRARLSCASSGQDRSRAGAPGRRHRRRPSACRRIWITGAVIRPPSTAPPTPPCARTWRARWPERGTCAPT